MPKSSGKSADPLERWRHFEAQYAESVARYLGGGDSPELDKDVLVTLIGLRTKADRWMERYYKACREAQD